MKKKQQSNRNNRGNDLQDSINKSKYRDDEQLLDDKLQKSKTMKAQDLKNKQQAQSVYLGEAQISD